MECIIKEAYYHISLSCKTKKMTVVVPSCEERSVMGDKLRREAQDLRVGLELGLGVKDRFVGTGIYIDT